jgi:Alpha/beta hydrolase domain
VEPVHPAGGIEVFSVANRFFLTRGDVVVHIDTPGRFPSTKKFSAERYAPLSMPDRSLFWTSISQVATLLKVGGPDSPLPVPARHLYMTGYSGSADTVYTFLSYHHKLTCMPNGKPVFSGYLPMSHIMPVPPIDAVIVTTATQTDMFGATDGDTPATSAFRIKFNSDAPEARRRRYELPGAFHAPFQPPEAGMAIPLHHYEPGNFAACSEAQKWPVEALPDHVPNRAMLEACFYHASRWAVDGIVPPHAPLIEVDANGVTEKDENGNVKGGLRFPDIAVPVETFISAARGGTRNCASTGYSLAFSREKLVSLYGSREQYLARYDAAADKLVKDGYILHEGAAQLKSDRRWLAPVF